MSVHFEKCPFISQSSKKTFLFIYTSNYDGKGDFNSKQKRRSGKRPKEKKTKSERRKNLKQDVKALKDV